MNVFLYVLFQKLKSLELAEIKVLHLDPSAFHAVRDSLQTLKIDSCSLNEVPSDSLTVLQSLQTLHLVRMDIQELRNDSFSGLSNLITLYLTNDNISQIQYNAFSGLTGLRRLDLSHNPLKVITGLHSLSNCEYLRLINVSIRTLPYKTFVNSSLVHLILTFNTIDHLFPHLLRSKVTPTLSGNISRNCNSINQVEKRFQFLLYLDMSYSSIELLPGNLQWFSSLSILYMRKSNMTDIKAGLFSGLCKLRSLYLEGNAISHLKVDDFTGLANLQNLYLQRNHIRCIDQYTFSTLSHLRALWITSNLLTVVENTTFIGLTNLRTLMLDFNRIVSIAVDAFRYMGGLRLLSVSYNPLETVSPVIGTRNVSHILLYGVSMVTLKYTYFSDYSLLTTLRMQNNGLVHIFPDAFIMSSDTQLQSTIPGELCTPAHGFLSKVSSLTVLDLQKNQIHLRKQNFQYLPALTKLILSENIISVLPKGTFCNLTNLKSLRLDHNRIKHIDTGTFDHLINLNYLTLHSNQIIRIAETAFHKMSLQTFIRLEDNHLKRISPGMLLSPGHVLFENNPIECSCEIIGLRVLILKKVLDNKRVICTNKNDSTISNYTQDCSVDSGKTTKNDAVLISGDLFVLGAAGLLLIALVALSLARYIRKKNIC